MFEKMVLMKKIWVQEGRGNKELEVTELWGGFMISTANQKLFG